MYVYPVRGKGASEGEAGGEGDRGDVIWKELD